MLSGCFPKEPDFLAAGCLDWNLWCSINGPLQCDHHWVPCPGRCPRRRSPSDRRWSLKLRSRVLRKAAPFIGQREGRILHWNDAISRVRSSNDIALPRSSGLRSMIRQLTRPGFQHRSSAMVVHMTWIYVGIWVTTCDYVCMCDNVWVWFETGQGFEELDLRHHNQTMIWLRYNPTKPQGVARDNHIRWNVSGFPHPSGRTINALDPLGLYNQFSF